MRLSKINLLLISFLAGLALWLPNAGIAQAAALPDLLPACVETGACRVCDIVNIFVTLGRWLIAGAAGLALLVIVFAGSNIVMSTGNADKVGAAKKQIVGAVLGLGLVLIAFQFVSFIIFALTTPAAEQNFATSQIADTGKPAPQNLGSFLLGVPWWKICDVQELLAKEGKAPFPSTANCAYWGDGTICDKKNTGAKKCCQGECTNKECKTTKAAAPVAGPAEAIPALNSEEAVRAYLAKGGVAIQNNKRSCSINSSGAGCINVFGLSKVILDKLIFANSKCSRCIVITGGTEPGHQSHGLNFPNTVDIDYSSAAATALEAVGIRNNGGFGTGYTCEKSGGIAVPNCSGADWMHVEL